MQLIFFMFLNETTEREGLIKSAIARLARSSNRSNLTVVRIWTTSVTKQVPFLQTRQFDTPNKI